MQAVIVREDGTRIEVDDAAGILAKDGEDKVVLAAVPKCGSWRWGGPWHNEIVELCRDIPNITVKEPG